MPDINDCYSLAKEANPFWRVQLAGHFGVRQVDIEDKEDDLRYQKLGVGDFILRNMNEGNRDLRIEAKTRAANYYPLFLRDKKILIETIGNIDQNKTGSAIINCKADLLAYGWFDRIQKRLLDYYLFRVEPLTEWLQTNARKYTIKNSETNGIYRTQNILIPMSDLRRFII